MNLEFSYQNNNDLEFDRRFFQQIFISIHSESTKTKTFHLRQQIFEIGHFDIIRITN